MNENLKLDQSLDRRDSLPRSTVLLLAGLVVLLMAAALTSGWLFNQIRGDYSRLVAETAASLNDIQDITLHAGIGYADLTEFALNPDPGRRAELLAGMAGERAANDKVFEELRRSVADPEIKRALDSVIARRLDARKASEEFITSCQVGDSADVLAANAHRVMLCFQDYEKSCDKLGDMIRADCFQVSARMDAEVSRLRLLFFGLGVFPIGLALVLFFLTLRHIGSTSVEVELRDAVPGFHSGSVDADRDRNWEPETRA